MGSSRGGVRELRLEIDSRRRRVRRWSKKIDAAPDLSANN